MSNQKLYRGASNNGVHTVLTEDAVHAYQLIFKNEDRRARDDAAAGMAWVLERGVFCFAQTHIYPTLSSVVVGTLADLDAWTGGHLECVGFDHYVPFSNGRLDDPFDAGYKKTAREVILAFGLIRAENPAMIG
jgi:hypothetical protein